MLSQAQAEMYQALNVKLINATKRLNKLCNRTMSREQEGFTEMLKAEQKVWAIEDEMKVLINV